MPKPLLAGPRRARRRVGLALLAITAVAVAVGVILGAGPTGSSRGADPAARSSGATTVQRRDLVATDTESGTLSYANPQTVYNRINGTITWLPAVGQLIKPGHTLYKVDNQPVVLFNGTTPAYRDLTSGISDGPDVKELNQELVSMGFDPSHEITVNDSWQTGTTDAIDRWQASLGETQTGTITLGQVVFLPGPERVTTVAAARGSTGGSGAGGAGSGGGESGGSGSGSGGAAASATPILQTASDELDVVVDLDANKQSEAVVGEPVTVQMPTGRVVDGKITKVSPIAQSSSNGSGSGSSGSGGSGGVSNSSSTPSATIPVTIALHGRLASSGLDQSAVSVNFEKQVERDVLSVPVTALLATAGGGYVVQEAARSHRLIPVTPGLFAAGYVQISSSSQIHAGLQVTDSQG